MSLAPDVVRKSDAQKQQYVTIGTIIDVTNVVIEGDREAGALAGALIGALIGVTSRINEAEKQGDNTSSVNNDAYIENYIENNQIISTEYSISMVYNTQIALISLGYYVGVYDGSFTQNTADAIKSYQQNNSLIANGFPSKELYKHIKNNVAILYSEE